MNDFYRLLQKLKEHEELRFAMATVIGVDGSFYRRVGAKMLFGAEGNQYGTLSAGCLEEDLWFHAVEVMREGKTKIVSYDLRSEDDLSWGQGAGCNGSIEVFVEPLAWSLAPPNRQAPVWSEIEGLLEQGRSVVSVKAVKGQVSGGSLYLFTEQGSISHQEDDSSRGREKRVQAILPKVQNFLAAGKKVELVRAPQLESDFLMELYEPKTPLYIFGAGPDVEPLVPLAVQMDFRVSIVDPRSSRCNKEVFPKADALIVEHPDRFLQKTKIPEDSYVIIMTHSFQRDKQILQYFLSSPPRYLGVLGPKRRTERLTAPHPVPDWVHSPIGLGIGADGPDEISISIMAELLQVRNAKRLLTKS